MNKTPAAGALTSAIEGSRSLDYGRVDEGADGRENIVDDASQLGHGGHRCQGYHAGGESVFHKVLPTGVSPNAIQEALHRDISFAIESTSTASLP
jgi:hypothetical protein